nr:ras-related protein Ral-A isoform X1 [Cavia porcellus]
MLLNLCRGLQTISGPNPQSHLLHEGDLRSSEGTAALGQGGFRGSSEPPSKDRGPAATEEPDGDMPRHTRENPRPKTARPPPHCAGGDEEAPCKQDGGLPSLPRAPSRSQQKRGRRGPRTSARPLGHSRTAGRGASPPGAQTAKGGAAPEPHTGRKPASPRTQSLCSRPRPPSLRSAPADGKCSPSAPPRFPAPRKWSAAAAAERPGGGWLSPERSSESSSCSSSGCPDSAAARRTLPPPPAALAAEPPRRPGPRTLSSEAAQPRLLEPAGGGPARRTDSP